MSRHRNIATGVEVSVDDDKDLRFGGGWEPVDRPASKPAPKPKPKK